MYVDGILQTMHDFLQGIISNVDGAIVFEWDTFLIERSEEVRSGENNILVMNGYAVHLHFRKLDPLYKTRVICVALPSPTSLILQPLDVSVFYAYKSY